MQIQSGEDPFKLWVRREDASHSGLTVRFETEHGMGLLGIRVPNRKEPAPTSHYEEVGVEADALRGGRFVHILPNGPRRSYALSRLTIDLVSILGVGKWVELEPITEYGFRYLVFPKEMPAPETAPASVVAEVRPTPVASTVSTPTPSRSALPPRQTPIAPELAHEALAGLSHQGALQHLKMEMAKVEALHKRIDELERDLVHSRSREADLLDVLKKWQGMS